jgi:hypothetical protein
MTEAAAGARMTLGALVLPGVLGASTNWMPLGEPLDDINYRRGKIIWTDMTGEARLFLPAGEWTHLLFYQQDGYFMRANVIGQHPLFFPKPGVLDVKVNAVDFLKAEGFVG